MLRVQEKLPDIPYPQPRELTDEEIQQLRHQLNQTTVSAERILVLDKLASHILNSKTSIDGEQYAKEVLQIAKQFNDTCWIARAYECLAWYAYAASQVSKAERYLHKALRLLEPLSESKMGVQIEKSAIFILLGLILMNRGNRYEDALNMYVKSIQYYKKYKYELGVANALKLMGTHYLYRGFYAEALVKLDEALNIFKVSSEEDGIAQVLSMMAKVYTACEDFELAIKILRQALQYTLGERSIAMIQENLGNAYTDQGEYQQALSCYTKALSYYDDNQEITNSGFILLNIARLYAFWRKFDLCYKYFDRAEKIFLSQESPIHIALFQSDKGEAFVKQKKWDQAVSILSRAYQTLHNANVASYEMEVCKNMAVACEAIGNVRESLTYYKRFMQLQKEMISDEVRKKIHSYQLRIQLQRVEEEKETYRTRSEQLKQQNEYQKKELAAISSRIAQTTTLFDELRERLVGVKDLDAQTSQSIKEMIRDIDARGQSVEAWDVFERQLQHLDQEFVAGLMDNYPSLTPAEIRMCLLLTVGMTNKEMASLLNISNRTVDTHRTSIRKKMGLQRQDDLVVVLSKI